MCCTRFDFDSSSQAAAVGSGKSAGQGTAATREARRFVSLVALGATAILVVALAAAAMVAGATEPTHDITLVARDMAFYLPDGSEPNPRIEVGPREEVRITLVNRDRGIDHDFAVTALGVESPAIPGDGSSTTVAFRAPREQGEHEYVCRLHGRMMRGTLVVR